MATAVTGAALYMPPRGAAIHGLEDYAPYPCNIIGVMPIPLVSAVVTAPPGTGPFTSWVAENVPYVDGDTDPALVPSNGGYVAPLGFVIPAPVVPDPVEDTNGNAIIAGQAIWSNPNTTPTTTPLDQDIAPDGYLLLPMV